MSRTVVDSGTMTPAELVAWRDALPADVRRIAGAAMKEFGRIGCTPELGAAVVDALVVMHEHFNKIDAAVDVAAARGTRES